MTHVEAKEILKARVEWKNPLDTRFSFLNFTPSESGRYLQEEHASVKIPIIYNLVVDEHIEDADFKQYLIDEKEKAIIQMLHDVFIQVGKVDREKLDNTELFDYAIILKLTINTISNILNSNRLNMIETVTKDNLQRYYLDLNGIKDRENGVFVSGFVERYRIEIDRIRKALFIKNKGLKVVTAR